jgi:Icc-related predicted phosphoesterase
MMEVVDFDAEPLTEIRFLNASRRGRAEAARLVVQRARVRGLPSAVDAIVATSDLQGIVPDPRTRESTLLGVAVADAIEQLADEGVVPRAARTGVILAGDLYAVPTAKERGGHGSVAAVWDAFARPFAWVVGVAGNHDDVSGVVESDEVVVLDASRATLGGLRIGGVGLVSGNPDKLGRRSEDDQLERIEQVARAGVDVLVLHEGPDGAPDQRGHGGVRAIVEEARVPLTICGHVHWQEPLARHARGQILNVDARVVVLTR